MNLICREDLITGLIGLIIVLQFIFCSSVGKGLFMIQNEDITMFYTLSRHCLLLTTEVLRLCPYLVLMRENMDQKILRI